MPTPPRADATGPPLSRRRDALIAIRNAVIVGGSLFATWSVALVVRFFLPRYLGPDRFGAFNYADVMSQVGGVFFELGIISYVQKEIAVRPRHASDFFGGVSIVRAFAALVVAIGMASFLGLEHRSAELQRTVFLCGISQLVGVQNATLAAMLHANRTVGRLAITNVAGKIIWGAGVAVAILIGGRRLEPFALAYLVSEISRYVVLVRTTRRELGLKVRIDVAATRAVLIASAPYYVASAAQSLYQKVDVGVMSVLLSDRELGFYGAAGTFSVLSLLLAPLVGAILMPQLARAAAESDRELLHVLRRIVELLVVYATPVALMLGLGADVLVALVFGPRFAPCVPSVRVLSCMFIATYLAMVISSALLMLNRSWEVTWISIASVPLNLLLNALLLRFALRWFGEGGGGTVAAAISVFTEMSVVAAMLFFLRRNIFDEQASRNIAKTAVGVAVAIGVHLLLHRAGTACLAWPASPLRVICLAGCRGFGRLAVDASVYLVIVIASGALNISQLLGMVRAALSRRRGNPA